MLVKVLCIGDIVGKPGRHILAEHLADYVETEKIDCVIANAENAAGGSGLTPQIYDKLIKYGVNLITLGDHAYRRKEIIPILDSSDNITRPANLSSYSAGKDFAVYETAKGVKVGVCVLIGRTFMKPADCPYAKIDSLLPKLSQLADIVLLEVHAEATSDKIALSYYLDGKVAAVYGTHTHVMTADAKILEKGTAYITDIGMTGAHDSVLGRKVENVIKSFRTQMPYPFEIATGDVRINGAVFVLDSNRKNAVSVNTVQLKEDNYIGPEIDSDDGHGTPRTAF